MLHEDDIVLVFEASQEARHSAILRANEMARALVERAKAGAAGQPADEDGVVPGPRPLRLVLGFDFEDLTVKQRGFLHKVVLTQIAENYVFPDGSRYAMPIWKELFRARFLGDRWVSKKAIRWDAKTRQYVQAKRATPHRERVSTEDLSIKQYSQYIDTVIDTAMVELGMVFEFRADEREGVRYRKPVRAKKAVAA